MRGEAEGGVEGKLDWDLRRDGCSFTRQPESCVLQCRRLS